MAITVPDLTKLATLANKEVLAAGAGVGAGAIAGTVSGEFVKTSLNLTGNAGLIAKSATKALLAVALGVVSLGRTGLLRVFGGLASLGSFGSMFQDLIEMLLTYVGFPGGATAMGQIAGAQLRSLALGSRALAPKSTGQLKIQGASAAVDSYSNQGIPGKTAVSALAAAGVTPYTGTQGKVTDLAGRV